MRSRPIFARSASVAPFAGNANADNSIRNLFLRKNCLGKPGKDRTHFHLTLRIGLIPFCFSAVQYRAVLR